MTWVRSGLLATAGISSIGLSINYAYSKYLEGKFQTFKDLEERLANVFKDNIEKNAVKAFKDHKLSYVTSYWKKNHGLETGVAIYASYGVVKDGKFTKEPGSFIGRVEVLKDNETDELKIVEEKIEDEVMKPIATYLRKELLKLNVMPYPSLDPLWDARKQWQSEELEKGDLGHSSRLKISPIKKEEERDIAYYTEVALLALGLGYSMKDFYDCGPRHLDQRLKPNGGIEIDCQESGEIIRTPLGSFQRWDGPKAEVRSQLLKNVKTKITRKEGKTDWGTHYGPLKTVVFGTRGQGLFPAERISHEELIKQVDNETYQEHKAKWARLRDPVFLRVNEVIKKMKD